MDRDASELVRSSCEANSSAQAGFIHRLVRFLKRQNRSPLVHSAVERTIHKLCRVAQLDLLDVLKRERGDDSHAAERMVIDLANKCGLNLLDLAYHNIGVNKWETPEVSGETFVIERVLTRLIKKPTPMFFDVGANEGDYSMALRAQFPTARIVAFEPQPQIFARCAQALATSNVDVHNVALGAEAATANIYDYAREHGTAHASLHQEVLTAIHKGQEIKYSTIVVETLDHFCNTHGIDRIDFLKIDTEGHEYAVLEGARDLLRENCIDVIQFEFNEMNIVSRRFLRDFYTLLPNHRFYRLDSRRLIPIWDYSSWNEVFRFQNILAIPKTSEQFA
ncbi:MAG: FkbM family methyltransferase [Planctomycetes bacterium]|nr:FkbM family methyltransferase [Planctomycetota bacterium]